MNQSLLAQVVQKGIIRRARRSELLQLAHSLVLLCTALLIVMTFHFMNVLSQGGAAWAGFIGAVLAVLGAILLAADKGALCLTMSALDIDSFGLPSSQPAHSARSTG